MSSTKKINQETIVNHLKNYGFVFPNSEIYNGLANGWDFGPLGTIVKNQIKKLWNEYFVYFEPDMVSLDSAILMNPEVWKASGHLSNFADPLIDCKSCRSRYRADKLVNEFLGKELVTEQTSFEEIEKIIKENSIKCPNCGKGDWTEIRNFNLMFKTYNGVIDDNKNIIYLRPETAQGIFVNFSNIQRSLRLKLPFGVGQIGKSFRNEITPGNFIFRTKEFEQMEIEYFTFAEKALETFDYFKNKIENFIYNILSINKENIKVVEHKKEELSHYAKKTIDFEYNFPHGWSELWGLAYRGDFDLSNHQNYSKKNLWYLDPETNQKIIPHVIEPSVGVERLFYAVICDAYKVENVNNEERVVLSLNQDLAPYEAIILPLVNKLNDEAYKIYVEMLKNKIRCAYDKSGSIGKRYRRADAIGAKYCITFDFDSLNDQKVTIRERDIMQQERIKIDDIYKYIRNKNGK